jgi:hypothetical protein
MTFTNQQYNGDSNGKQTLLVIKGGNFVGSAATTSTTTEYVSAGGDTFGTAAELTQFRANVAYLNYVQNAVSSSTIKTTSSDLFTNSGSGQTGNGSDDVQIIPDPRISHRITFPSGATNGIGKLAPTGPTHMTQLVVTDNDSSKTFDCYFARFFDGFTSGTTASIEVMLVGITGGDATGGFLNRAGPFLFETPTGATSQAIKDSVQTLKNVNSFKEFIKDQVGNSLDGSTFDLITYGKLSDKTAVFFRGSTDLNQLASFSSLAAANLGGRTTGNISTIHLPFVGTSSATSSLLGVTFNAQTGGCGPDSYSEFDDAVGQLFKVRSEAESKVGATIRAFDSITTIRELTNTAF